MKELIFTPIIFFLAILRLCFCQRYVNADGSSDAYQLFNSVLGGTAVEDPDCSHTSFGKHITQQYDNQLARFVFVFHIHARPDNDRCQNLDRQRNEVKTYNSSPDYLKAFYGEKTTYSWNFFLPSDFIPAYSFCHIHQIKTVGGNDAQPVITFTSRKATTNSLQLIHNSDGGTQTIVQSIPLAPFLGNWVKVVETLTHTHNGQYSVVITNLSSGQVLLNYSNNNIDLWRTGSNISRPKWGIYRSLNHINDIKDETVLFDRFCLAKGNDQCN